MLVLAGGVTAFELPRITGTSVGEIERRSETPLGRRIGWHRRAPRRIGRRA
jgi:hypothetical protein